MNIDSYRFEMGKRKYTSRIDGRIINIDDDYDIDYWITQLKTTKQKLQNAVKVAVTAVEDVKKELKKI